MTKKENNLLFCCFFKEYKDVKEEWESYEMAYFTNGHFMDVDDDHNLKPLFEKAICKVGKSFEGIPRFKEGDFLFFFITRSYTVHEGTMRFNFPKQVLNKTQKYFYEYDFKRKKSVKQEYAE